MFPLVLYGLPDAAFVVYAPSTTGVATTTPFTAASSVARSIAAPTSPLPPGTSPLSSSTSTFATVAAGSTTIVSAVTDAAATATTLGEGGSAGSSSGQAASPALAIGLQIGVALLLLLAIALYARWRFSREREPVKPDSGEQLYEVPLTPLGSVREAPFMLGHIYDNVSGAVELGWPDDDSPPDTRVDVDDGDDAASITSLDPQVYDLPRTSAHLTQPVYDTADA